MTKKGFVISWFYPPGNSSEGLVTYKLLKESNFSYDIWTRTVNNESGLWDRSSNETELTSDNINIIQKDASNVDKWLRDAVDFFLAHQDEYDFIMTRSMPAYAHTVGKILKSRCKNIKWIASYGDPIIDTPYVVVKDKHENPFLLKQYYLNEHLDPKQLLRVAISPTRYHRKRIWQKDEQDYFKKELSDNEKINNDTLSGADLIILNNHFQYDCIFKEKYANLKNKGVIIPHSYDLSLYKDTKTKNSKIIFSYFGHLDSTRNATSLLEAVAKLKEYNPQISKLVEFHFYGHMPKKDRLLIVDHQLFNLVFLHGDISYKESLAKMKESDWNILIDANFTEKTDHSIFFPAKLADYLGAGKNIFAITHLSGASAEIIRATGGGIITTHSVDDIFMNLSKIIFNHYNAPQYIQEEVDKYNNKNVAKLLDEKIQKLLK